MARKHVAPVEWFGEISVSNSLQHLSAYFYHHTQRIHIHNICIDVCALVQAKNFTSVSRSTSRSATGGASQEAVVLQARKKVVCSTIAIPRSKGKHQNNEKLSGKLKEERAKAEPETESSATFCWRRSSHEMTCQWTSSPQPCDGIKKLEASG